MKLKLFIEMKKWMVPIIFFVLTVSLAWADGDCPTRKMNSSETAEFNTLQNSIRAALPKPPADYKEAFIRFDRQQVCESHASDEMLRMYFKVQYEQDNAVFVGRMQSAMMDKVKGTPEQQKRKAALEAKEKELYGARNSTRDPGEKNKIRAELKAVRAEERVLDDEIDAQYEAWSRSGGDKKMMQNLQSSTSQGDFSIEIFVNQNVYVYDTANPYPVQGASLAFEESNKCGDSKNYCITIILGSFEKGSKGSGRYELRNANRGVSTKARGMGLLFSGPKDKAERVQDLAKKTNLAKLNALLR